MVQNLFNDYDNFANELINQLDEMQASRLNNNSHTKGWRNNKKICKDLIFKKKKEFFGWDF